VTEGKGVRFIMDDHEQKPLKVGKTLMADAIPGEGARWLSAKGVDEREQGQGQKNMGTGGSQARLGKAARCPPWLNSQKAVFSIAWLRTSEIMQKVICVWQLDRILLP
jgi:hypothetical protein